MCLAGGGQKARALSDIAVRLRQSDYNPVEEPSWNSAASMAISALQNGGSWLSPLGSGAPAASPSHATSQVHFPSWHGRWAFRG